MRMKTGLIIGFVAGYVLGAKAGRERYEQMRGWFSDFQQTKPYEKAQAAVELGVERVKQQVEPLVDSVTPGDGGTTSGGSSSSSSGGGTSSGTSRRSSKSA